MLGCARLTLSLMAFCYVWVFVVRKHRDEEIKAKDPLNYLSKLADPPRKYLLVCGVQ